MSSRLVFLQLSNSGRLQVEDLCVLKLLVQTRTEKDRFILNKIPQLEEIGVESIVIRREGIEFVGRSEDKCKKQRVCWALGQEVGWNRIKFAKKNQSSKTIVFSTESVIVSVTILIYINSKEKLIKYLSKVFYLLISVF